VGTASLRRRVAGADPTLRPPELLAGLLEPLRPESVLEASTRASAVGLPVFREAGGAALATSLGLGRAAAVRLRLCAELVDRAERGGWSLPPAIGGPRDVLPHVMDIREAPSERVVAIYLDCRNRPLRRELVAAGGLHASTVQPRDVLAPALALPAAGLVLVHNHPSGDCAPSRDDLELTRQLAAAARLLGLELLDHVIVSRSGCLSLRELGAM
jgi:DNA repair protein RadC